MHVRTHIQAHKCMHAHENTHARTRTCTPPSHTQAEAKEHTAELLPAVMELTNIIEGRSAPFRSGPSPPEAKGQTRAEYSANKRIGPGLARPHLEHAYSLLSKYCSRHSSSTIPRLAQQPPSPSPSSLPLSGPVHESAISEVCNKWLNLLGLGVRA